MATKESVVRGKRLKPFIWPYGLPPAYMEGVQSFGWSPNITRESRGQFGSKGDVISYTDYTDVSGNIDTELDEKTRLVNNALFTGQDPDKAIYVDFADLQTCWYFLHELKDDFKTPRRSTLVIDMDITKPDYSAQLKNMPTARYDFSGLRAIEFLEHVIHYESFTGDGTKKVFNFSRKAIAVEHELLLHKHALVVRVTNKGNCEVVGPDKVRVEPTKAVFLSTAPAQDALVEFLLLIDPTDTTAVADTTAPVIVRAVVTADDTVLLVFSDGLKASTVNAADFEVNEVAVSTATGVDNTITLTLPVGTIAKGAIGAEVVYTKNATTPLTDEANNAVESQTVQTE